MKLKIRTLLSLLIVLSIFVSCKKKNSKKKKEEQNKIVKTDSDLSGKHSGNLSKVRNIETGLKELSMTISFLRSYYYDPTKLKAKEMLFAGLDQLQSTIAAVAYKKLSKKSIEVQVDQAKKTFSVSDLDNLGKLRSVSGKILNFTLSELKKTGADKEEVTDALYNYINGFLNALDPYSVLINPKYNDEFAMQTKGAYGGVGMVLSIRDFELTVIKPQPGGPAIEAGIKKDDKIVQINDRSTVNMPLTEAVGMIRGIENTVVNIWIKRKTGKKTKDGKFVWTKPKNYPLTRRRIAIKSVSAKMLHDGKGNIAYFRINHFISHSISDLTKKYREFEKKYGAINGIILDLTDNPGGLLTQAIHVVNAFADKGVIVSTEGAPGTQKRVVSADKNNTLTTTTPMAILVSGGSASASEIVSGTLKNMDRALIIGNTTYGKGTVQQIFSQGKKEPVLKMTIRQYLTNGDVSIQQVGVVPHIRFVPIGMVGGLSLFWPDKPRKINKRTRSIKSDKVRPPEKPRYEVRYYKTKIEKRKYTTSVDDDMASKDTIEFAYDILTKYGKPKASQTLDSISSYIKDKISLEEKKMESDLSKTYKINWNKGKLSAIPAKFKTEVIFCSKKNLTKAKICKKPAKFLVPGEPSAVTVKITNVGKVVQNRVYAIVKSPSYIIDSSEFLFGSVKPGKFRYWTSEFTISKRTSVAIEPLTIQLYERGRGKLEKVEKNMIIKTLPKPEFAVSWWLHEEKQGDSVLQKGEHFVLDLKVSNIGKGISESPRIAVIDRSKGEIYLTSGREIPKKIEPGKSSSAQMKFRVVKTDKPVEVEIEVYDGVYRKGVSRKITLPTGNKVIKGVISDKHGILKKNTEVWSSAIGKVHQLGTADGIFKSTGKYGDYCRLIFPSNVIGFAKCKLIPKVKNLFGKLKLFTAIVPPTITFDTPPEAITTKESIHISGSAYHPENLRDFYILITNFDTDSGRKKVFFAAGKGKTIKFNTNIPLEPGLNHILLVARYDKDLIGHYLFSVVRKKQE